MMRLLLLVVTVNSMFLLSACSDQDAGIPPTKFSGQHDGSKWELIVTEPEDRDRRETEGDLCTSLGWEESGGGRGGWGDYCAWTLPSADQVLQPIMLRPGGGGYPGKLHGLAGSDIEEIRVVFADRSTSMASIVPLEPARVPAVGYVAFFEAGAIPRLIEGIGPSGSIIDEVQVPEGYADDPARSIPGTPSDP